MTKSAGDGGYRRRGASGSAGRFEEVEARRRALLVDRSDGDQRVNWSGEARSETTARRGEVGEDGRRFVDGEGSRERGKFS